MRAQLTLPACIGTLDSFSKNAVLSAVVCHPLTPTLVCGDTNGKVTVWDYQQNRTLHHFDAGMPGRTIAGCGLIKYVPHVSQIRRHTVCTYNTLTTFLTTITATWTTPCFGPPGWTAASGCGATTRALARKASWRRCGRCRYPR